MHNFVNMPKTWNDTLERGEFYGIMNHISIKLLLTHTHTHTHTHTRITGSAKCSRERTTLEGTFTARASLKTSYHILSNLLLFVEVAEEVLTRKSMVYPENES